jgi:hypothetical protein
MRGYRAFHAMTVLEDGTVLAPDSAFSTSRADQGVSAGSERFDPVTGTWSATEPMLEARGGATVTRLGDGRVLVAGGTAKGKVLDTAELFDPSTGRWSAAGRMSSPRSLHTATLLPDGRVLVCGGLATLSDTLDVRASAELFDPSADRWSPTPAMSTPRVFHTATALADGTVLVTGGLARMASLSPLTSAEVFDPRSDSWSPTGDLVDGPQFQVATLVPGGGVLVLGVNGLNDDQTVSELYDATTGTWTAAPQPSVPHPFGVQVGLADGRVLIAGGADATGNASTTAELFDPVAGSWSPAAHLAVGRNRAAGVLLLDGRVLVAGGQTGLGSTTLNSAELFTP